MSDRETYRATILLGMHAVREAERVATMAEENLARAIEEAEAARERVLVWTEAVEEASRRFVASAPVQESGVRLESWRRPEGVEAA